MKQDKLLIYLQRTATIAAILSFLACLLVSCKTTHEIQTEYVDRYVHDSVYIERVDTLVKVQEHRDSVILRDSVFVNVWQSADTIFKIKEVWKYRDRVSVKHDTIKDVQVDVRYKERVDTAYIEKVQVKTEYVKRGFSFWQHTQIYGFWASIILLVIIYRKKIFQAVVRLFTRK